MSSTPSSSPAPGADLRLVRAFTEAPTEERFRSIYEPHAGAVWRFALQLTREPMAAEEVVQEAWVRVVERLADFDGRSGFRTWLLGFVRNCVRERRRKWSRDLARREGEAVVDHQSPTSSSASVTVRLDLRAALQQLAPGYREVLYLHDVEGHTHAEIAAILGIDVGTSKSQLSRARRQLRDLLGGPEP